MAKEHHYHNLKLLYDPQRQEQVSQRLLPLFGDRPLEAVPYKAGKPPLWPEGETTVVCYLGDRELAMVLPLAMEQGWRLALLPHPELNRAKAGFGIAANLPEAVADIFTGEERWVDLLLVNGRPVLQSVVLGEVFDLAPGSHVAGFSARLTKFFGNLKRLTTLYLKPYTFKTALGKTLHTAALGVLLVEHTRSSLLTRNLLPDSNINDGMMHAMILAPRSLLGLLRHLLGGLLGFHRGSQFPPFAGHIKTGTLEISAPTAIDYQQDGLSLSQKKLVCETVPKALRLLPGRHLTIDRAVPPGKERFRIQGLPTGEARTALLAKSLPILPHAATEDFKELYQALRQNALATPAYLTLMVLSTLLATIGLFANSPPVIIGAMILAPLMAPIISLAMGVARQDTALLAGSARTLALGVVLGLGCAALLAALLPLKVVTTEIGARLTPTLLDLGVAIISGIAGAYAHARAEVARSLAGVAIAVALVPPLAVAGIGIGWGDWSVLWGASLLFLTNLAGIVLAAGLTFLTLGYAPFHRARRGLLITMAAVTLISIPLLLGFMGMKEEQTLVSQLEGLTLQEVTIREVRIRPGEPLHLSLRLISAGTISDGQLEEVKTAIENRIGRPIVLEATMSIVR
ncbi:DUF389 domain-containing protein [Desulfurivibrio alkaliphilus]|uniref:TIGR00341 family protein n=1 Tax=Desulfurivibrio alkaliphilus (strain DSM 19089 / UNIQEM U267 / AHT2) TaxID=589865 RepID=D6Z708_DESAT|nr:DUF389 domain-containing protein [Desulfurivibrio alkaliphilus]ADH86995.1 conserved hypothetical protein [Desulfurivibrio alkaliphilus AHT 2]